MPQFYRSPSYPALAELLPPNFCPLLFYNLAPYIFSLAWGGWFGWTRKTRRPRARKRPVAKMFDRKGVNRHYLNEVLVRCPHPGKKVVAGVGRWDADRLALRIVHDDQRACPGRPRIGQRYLLDRRNYQTRAERFCRLFVEVLLDSLADLSLPAAIERFDQTPPSRLTLAHTVHPCRYHPQAPLRQTARLLPDGCCPHLFWAAYPHVLAGLAEAPVAPAFTVAHPAGSGDLDLALEKIPETTAWGVRRSRQVLHRVCRWMGYPRELLDYRLYLRIRADHRPGHERPGGRGFAVNLKNPEVLCPAAFQAVYPYLLLAAVNCAPPWASAAGRFQVCCPDCVGSRYWVLN